jgi:hypothetical protein
MLEDKLDNLIKSIDILSAAIMDLTVARPTSDPEPKAAPEPKAEAKPKAEKKAEAKPKAEAKAEAKGERNDKELQDLCLKIIRDDKKNGTKKGKGIKPLIKKYGGELIKDVPTEKLAELRTALEEL